MKTFSKLGLAATAFVSAASVQAADDKFDVNFGGRVMFDAAFVSSDDSASTTLQNHSGSEFRRVRLFAKGKGQGPNFSGWDFKLQLDFEEDKEVDLEDVYIRYAIHPGGKIIFGQFKHFFGMEELASSKYLDFMERSTANNSLKLARKRGIGYTGGIENTTWGLSVYSLENDNATEDEGMGFSARGTMAPVKTDTNVIHLGLAAATESSRGSDVTRVRYRTGYHTMANRVTGNFANTVDSPTRFGLEFAGVWGGLSVKSELMNIKWNEATAGGQDASMSNFYVNVLYTTGGKSLAKTYKNGNFGRLKASGVWQFGLRADMVNADLGTNNDLETMAYTFGVNYLVNSGIKFMTNLILAESEFENAANPFQDDTVLMFRGQIDF